MTIEERAREFFGFGVPIECPDGKPGCLVGHFAHNKPRTPKNIADFAAEAVKADRLKIADELERIDNNHIAYRDVVVKTRQYIAQLRGERE